MNIDKILLYISTGLIIISFVSYLFLIIFGRRKIVSKNDAFNVTKDIISEYNSINVIENSGYLTLYNIKRKVIKLASFCYYGKDLSSVSLSLMEASISVVDNNKNKYIDLFRYVFNNLKILYILPLLAVFINNSSFNMSDAKISIILISIFFIIAYMILDIKSQGCFWISNNLKKIKDISNNNREKIINFMNKLLLCDKLIIMGEIVIIVRNVLILLEII